MNKVIYKYLLQPNLWIQSVWMPINPVILDVQMQHNVLTIWAVVDPGSAMAYFDVLVIGTGQELPDTDYGDHIGTVQGGDDVWHVFIKT